MRIDFNDAIKWITNPAGQAVSEVGRAITGRDFSSIANPAGVVTAQVLGPKKDQAQPVALAGANSAAREADFAAGRKRGQEIFYDPEMTELRGRLNRLSEGYSGEEMASQLSEARNRLANQRGAYSRQLASNLARQGIGGARAAAMQQAGNQGFNQNMAQFERGLIADQAGMKRAGTDKLVDFVLGQKYGGLGTELGYAQLGANERGANAALAASQRQRGGLFSGIFDALGL